MLFPSSKASITIKLPTKAAEKVIKIRDLLSRALGEVHDETSRFNKYVSNSQGKRRSDESS
jgi:hypothetical protein